LVLVAGPKDFSVRAVLLLMKAVSFAVVLLCTGTLSVAILCPRNPPFLGYFFCRLGHDFKIFGDPCQLQDGELSIGNILSFQLIEMKIIFRILSGLISFAIYIPGLYSAHLITSYEVLPGLIFQKHCLAEFLEEITLAKFSDYKKTLGNYKQLQLLNIKFNEIYRRNFFAIIMACIVAIIVPTGYVILTAYHINQIILILGGFTVITEYVLVATIFSMAGKVWNSSVQFRYAWRKNTRLSSRPLSRRYGTSLQNLKIQIGSSNFVEKNTPFVFVSFLIEHTVALVIMNKVGFV
jgi:hypothetical protein